jgi:hypothetical protein
MPSHSASECILPLSESGGEASRTLPRYPVPLRLGFNANYGFLDGDHCLAAALRVGLAELPVELIPEEPELRRDHGRPMRPDDLAVLIAAYHAGGGTCAGGGTSSSRPF